VELGLARGDPEVADLRGSHFARRCLTCFARRRIWPSTRGLAPDGASADMLGADLRLGATVLTRASVVRYETKRVSRQSVLARATRMRSMARGAGSCKVRHASTAVAIRPLFGGRGDRRACGAAPPYQRCGSFADPARSRARRSDSRCMSAADGL